MKAYFDPNPNSPLYELSGSEGEILSVSGKQIEIRIPLEGHTEQHPSYAVIHTHKRRIRYK